MQAMPPRPAAVKHLGRHAILLSALLLGAVLRLWFIHSWSQVNGDSLIYADIARNWLLHGVYGRTLPGPAGPRIQPTLIRLPGYPLFLAMCFRVFGIASYRAVMYIQAAIDLLGCWLVSLMARQSCGDRAGAAALWLAALCPFTANYVATPLAETLSIFCVALGLFALVRLLEQPHWPAIAMLAVSWSYAALLRPDGVLLGATSFAALILFRPRRPAAPRLWRSALLAAALAILPFGLWTARNWRTFHVLQPLAPRYATEPGEFTAPGFQQWMKTWVVDFVSTDEIYWSENSDPMDVRDLPARAFDSPAQYRETRDLLAAYNRDLTITPALDARFRMLAAQRSSAHPLRTYLELPALRALDMWLRPRTETMNIELRWWEYGKHHAETEFAVAYAGLDLAFLLMAVVGAFRWPAESPVLLAAMLAYMLLRTLLLATIEGPEPRYTLECFPALFVLGGAAFSRLRRASPLRPAPLTSEPPASPASRESQIRSDRSQCYIECWSKSPSGYLPRVR
jgi:hypothetical protein